MKAPPLALPAPAEPPATKAQPVYQVWPIGWVHKNAEGTFIEIDAFPDTPVLDIKP